MSLTTAQRNPGLDTLRALAILFVMPFHIGALLPTFIQPVATFGWMGVDLFFVLSGYLIGGQLLRPAQLGKKISLANFYSRRAWRILPAYLVVLALYMVFPAWREAPGLDHAWKFLTFTLNLNIDYANARAFSHAWSLCVEEHFYLVLPLLTIALLRRPSMRKTAFIAAAVFLGGLALRAFALHHLRTLEPGSGTFDIYYLEDIYYPTWTRLDGLLFGVLLAATQIFRPSWWQALQRQSLFLFGAAIACIALTIPLFAPRYDNALGLAAAGTLVGFPLLSFGLACLLVSFVSPHSPLSRRIPGARLIATLAFSLYLSHKAVFHLVQLALPQFCEDHPVGVLPIYAISAFAVAAALYFAVERPCLKLRDRRRNADIEALTNPAI
jgi:peptidoglycan/LPS O-acetylase OafA/YrhL